MSTVRRGPSTTISASSLPTIGACWKPWPLNPFARRSPSRPGTRPMIGCRSGVISYRPTQRWAIAASASAGRTRIAVGRSSSATNRSSTRVSNVGRSAGSPIPIRTPLALAMEVEARGRVDHQGPSGRDARERSGHEDDPGDGSSGRSIAGGRRQQAGPRSGGVDRDRRLATRPSAVSTPTDRVTVRVDPGRPRPRSGCSAPARRAAVAIPEGQTRRVGDPVLGAEGRADDALRREPRDQLAGLPRVEQPDLDAEPALHLGRGLVVRPGRLVADAGTGSRPGRRRAGRPWVALNPVMSGMLAQRQLDVHPARELVPEAAGTAPGRAGPERGLALEEDDPSGPGGRQVVGRTEADRAAADDDDVGGGGRSWPDDWPVMRHVVERSRPDVRPVSSGRRRRHAYHGFGPRSHVHWSPAEHRPEDRPDARSPASPTTSRPTRPSATRTP